MLVNNKKWLLGIVITGSIFITIFGFCYALFTNGFNHEITAAWVQAFGSIVAIWSAIGIAWWQHHESQQRHSQQQKDNERRLLLNIFSMANYATNLLIAAYDFRKNPNLFDTAIDRKRDHAAIDDAANALAAIPLHEISHVTAVSAIGMLRGHVRAIANYLAAQPTSGIHHGSNTYAAEYLIGVNGATKELEALKNLFLEIEATKHC